MKPLIESKTMVGSSVKGTQNIREEYLDLKKSNNFQRIHNNYSYRRREVSLNELVTKIKSKQASHKTTLHSFDNINHICVSSYNSKSSEEYSAPSRQTPISNKFNHDMPNGLDSQKFPENNFHAIKGAIDKAIGILAPLAYIQNNSREIWTEKNTTVLSEESEKVSKGREMIIDERMKNGVIKDGLQSLFRLNDIQSKLLMKLQTSLLRSDLVLEREKLIPKVVRKNVLENNRGKKKILRELIMKKKLKLKLYGSNKSQSYDKAIAKQPNLKGERVYKCQKCFKKYQIKSLLTSHIKICHSTNRISNPLLKPVLKYQIISGLEPSDTNSKSYQRSSVIKKCSLNISPNIHNLKCLNDPTTSYSGKKCHKNETGSFGENKIKENNKKITKLCNYSPTVDRNMDSINEQICSRLNKSDIQESLDAFDKTNIPVSPQNDRTCLLCHKSFSCKSALEIHIRSHTKEKPYKCIVCSRGFTTKGNMRQHIAIHKSRGAIIYPNHIDPIECNRGFRTISPHPENTTTTTTTQPAQDIKHSNSSNLNNALYVSGEEICRAYDYWMSARGEVRSKNKEDPESGSIYPGFNGKCDSIDPISHVASNTEHTKEC